MSQRITIICDYCSQIKKDNNHWFKLLESHEQHTLIISDNPKANGSDACGRQCVQKAVEEFLGRSK